MELLSIAEIAARTKKTPQQFNKWVTQEVNPLPLAQEKPRKVDWDVYVEWMEATQTNREQIRTERKEARDAAKESGQTPVKVSKVKPLEELMMRQRKLLAWSRGEGRGWALGALHERVQPWIGNYVEIIKTSGKVHGANVSSLLKEATEGKLYFMDPDAVIAFLLGQLEAHPEAAMDENLKAANRHLRNAMRAIGAWKDSKGIDTNVLPDQELIDALRRELASEVVNDEEEVISVEE